MRRVRLPWAPGVGGPGSHVSGFCTWRSLELFWDVLDVDAMQGRMWPDEPEGVGDRERKIMNGCKYA